MKTLSYSIAVVVVAFSGAASAAGFAVDTQSARATGMATAVTAFSDDPSAIFYNPAGLVGGRGFELSLGDTAIAPNLSVTGPSGVAAATTGISPPPHLYARYQIVDRLAAGVGVFVPFGASSSWPEGWEGRFRTTGSSLNVYVINPEVAYQLHDRVRFGVGLQVARATVLLRRGLGFVDSEGEVSLGGATWGTGLNVGAQVAIVPEMLDLGVAWRSGIGLSVDGKAHFENVPVEFQSRLADQGVKTSVDLPDVINAGLSFRPMKQLRLAFDVHYVRWSSFPSLDLEFDNPEVSSSLAKNWQDTFSYHLGAEYAVSPAFTARAGVAYDPTPSPVDTLTPDLPDANRFKLALGAGYALKDFQVDLAYQFVLLNETVSTSPMYPATYGGTAHVLGLTLGWHAPF